MAVISISDFCKKVEAYMNRVSNQGETLIVGKGKDTDVVLMSLAEYNALMSTYHE